MSLIIICISSYDSVRNEEIAWNIIFDLQKEINFEIYLHN